LLGLKVVLDMHGLKGGQNGLNDSGHATPIAWSQQGTAYECFNHYDEWYGRNDQQINGYVYGTGGSWQGEFPEYTYDASYLDDTNPAFSVEAAKYFAHVYKNYDSLYAISVINEP
jgi:aryl-phospho-beta-D-glucosidase BglC (GH1 family)